MATKYERLVKGVKVFPDLSVILEVIKYYVSEILMSQRSIL